MKVLDAIARAGTPDAKLKAARFEDFLVRAVLPFTGGHLYLGAVVYQFDIHPETALTGAVIAILVGVLLLKMTSNGVLAAIGASSVLAALIFVLPPFVAALAIGVAVIAYAVGLGSGRLEGSGAALFFLQVPLLGVVVDGVPTPLRVSVTLVALLLATCLLLAARRVAFAGAALTGGLIVVVAETALDRAPVYLVGFVALLTIATMVYEMRRERRTQSPLRRAFAQLLGVALLAILSGLITEWDGTGGPLVWLLLVIFVQGAQMLLEQGSDRIRPMWIGIVLIVVTWDVPGLGDWRMRTAMTCAIVATLHAYALLARSRFVASVTGLLTVVPAAVAFYQAESTVFDPATLALQAMVTLTLLAQGMDPGRWQPQFRWWRGFISRAHWRTLTNISSMASKTIESVALVGTAVKLFRTAIGWVRYLNGGERIRLQDVLYAVGHVYGAWTVGTQITALASSLGWSWPAAALLGQIAWIAWALAVLIYGELRDDALSRYVGLILVCVPAITDPNWRIERTELFELWLLAATGIALSMYAAARTRARTRLVR